MYSIIKIIIASLCVITLLHYIWIFLKENYSTKKTVDIIGFQTKKYKTILDELLQNPNMRNDTHLFSDTTEFENMNEELENFIREEISL
jgi:hypothetical protein